MDHDISAMPVSRENGHPTIGLSRLRNVDSGA